MRTILVLLFMIVFFNPIPASGQAQPESSDKLTTWLILQGIPSFSWTTFPEQTNFAFEWEAAPVLYSFGMTDLVSPWNFFFVVPPARFTGSVELTVSGQVFTSKVGSSHFAYSGQLLGHIPLSEKGENLALNLGVAYYMYDTGSSTYGVLGFSTLFGLVHYNIKYSPKDKNWMNSIEMRLF